MLKKQDALVPIFGAICFFLSAIEFVVPKPLPFLRLGLANVSLVLALDVLSFPAFLLLASIKIIGQAVISGTLFSYVVLFSAAGTYAAALIMYGLRRIPKALISLVGISAAGAFVSNSIQLLLGRYLIFGEGIWYILPPFLCIGVISSVALGVFCEKCITDLTWYAEVTKADYTLTLSMPQEDTPHRTYPLLRIAIGLFLLLILLFVPGFAVKAAIFAASLLLCIVEKQKIQVVRFIISTVSIMLCHLIFPIGKELITIGSFSVTSGALLNGLEKVLILESMIHISRWTMQTPLSLPGRFGKMLNESLYIFKRLLELKDKIRPRALFVSIDEILLSLPFIINTNTANKR
ncbi:MAG: Gx transporter family protein [Treponema sp.]